MKALVLLMLGIVFVSGCTQIPTERDISSYALTEDDFPLPVDFSNHFEVMPGDPDSANYISNSYILEGLESVYVSQFSVNAKFSGEQIDKIYEATHVILKFPVVNGTINTSSNFVTGTDDDRLKLAVISEYINYGVVLSDENGELNENEIYEDFGFADNEFVYGFVTDNFILYGAFFTKDGFMQKISIFGVGIGVDDLKDLVEKAVNKI